MLQDVGFIGLGTMGRPMASNLLKAGYKLTVYDIDGAAVESLVNQGASAADSPREVAEASWVIVSMLPASLHSLAAASGPDGYIAGLRDGATVIDMSTIDPDTTREIAEAVAGAGGAMLDAPVSGSSAWATTGELTIMVGGDENVNRPWCTETIDFIVKILLDNEEPELTEWGDEDRRIRYRLRCGQIMSDCGL